MIDKLQIIPIDLLDNFKSQVSASLQNSFDALEDAEMSNDTFSFYVSVSSVYSSKIEGENIELDSYVKHKRFGIEFLPDYTKKIDDLYSAYSFAKKSHLNKQNIAACHRLLSKHIVATEWQGRFRMQNMYVTTQEGKIEYVAASPFAVAEEMNKILSDIDILLKRALSIEEVFYFASFIHLILVKIHPWNDGNGRTARLVEKWFLGEKLGSKAWYIQSEKMYYNHHALYYHNIRLCGLEYEELDYSQALPFLLMLPSSL